MKLVAIMPARNEDWVIGLSARAALRWCDAIAILDHASTDRTPEILADLVAEFPGRVSVTRIDDTGWYEMAHRDVLLTRAREMGATHIAIVDADEVLTANILHSIRETVETVPHGGILSLPGYNLRGSKDMFHASGIWGGRWFSLAFANDPRLCWSGDQFHHREPMGVHLGSWRPVQQMQGGIMHLWGASERRLRAKHAHYKVTERLRWPAKQVADIDAMYSLAIHGSPWPEYGRPDAWAYAAVPGNWWAAYADLMHHLDVDAEPWQEADTRRLCAEYGTERFAGLDLFGLEALCTAV